MNMIDPYAIFMGIHVQYLFFRNEIIIIYLINKIKERESNNYHIFIRNRVFIFSMNEFIQINKLRSFIFNVYILIKN